MEVWKIKTKPDSKETKDKIIDLFYEKHLRPSDIANQLKVAKSYITKVIQKDSRYMEEKESRKAKNKEKNRIQKRVCAKNRRGREKQERQEYEKLMLLINNDNVILSTKKKESDLQDAKWNRSVYEYAENSSDLVLNPNVNAGYNLAKRVRNIVNPDSIKSKRIYV